MEEYCLQVPIGELFYTTSGGTPIRENSDYYEGDIPWVKSGELEDNVIIETEEKITEEAVSKSSAKIFPKGTLLLALYGATIGKLALLGIDAATNQAVCGIFENRFFIQKYVYYFFLFRRTKLISLGMGGAQPNISQGIVKNQLFPVLSFPEQAQIVSIIDQLFSDLDNAIDNLQKAKDQLKIYRQSVLKYAFEGKLTEKHSIWERIPLSKVCEIKPSKKEVDNLSEQMDVSFLPMPNVSESGKIIKHDTRKIKEVRKGYTYFKNGDVLLAKITPCFENGKKAIAENLINGVGFGSTEFHVLRPLAKVLPKWIFMAVSLEDFRNKAILQMTGAVGQKRVPSRVVEEYEILVPSIKEQEGIIQEIESRFSVSEKMEETIENSLNQAEALRQSILKQAFEGKLTEDWRKEHPEFINGENSAKALLEKIKAEKEAMNGKPGKRQ